VVKAWLRIIEVVLAATIFLAFLSYVTSVTAPKTNVYEKTIGLKTAAEDVLVLLDNLPDGNSTFLRVQLANGNYSGIVSETDSLLPETFRFRYRIGDYESRGPPVQKEVVGQQYFVTVNNGTVATPTAVKLWVWYRT